MTKAESSNLSECASECAPAFVASCESYKQVTMIDFVLEHVIDLLYSLIMETNQKIILAAYIDVGSLAPSDVAQYMEQVTACFKHDAAKHNIMHYFIPIRGETRIECVYPNFLIVNQEDQASFSEKANQILDDMIAQQSEI